MAAVSAAMFGPGGGLDPSAPRYSTHTIYDPDTRTKRWSSKLKLNSPGSSKSPDKSDVPYMYGTIGPGGSALSKSMKYAETWLYGSVKTQTTPSRPSVFSAYPEMPGPVLISTPQKPTPHNYAVILCSCPEYLNGTKKTSSTKVSICKKCKGSRLPLTITDSPRYLVGGTVRGTQQVRDSGILRSGTLKVQGSKQRPSILKSNEEADPYDLMRRNRLVSPNEARIGSQFSAARSRAKSISPSRGKSKREETLRQARSRSVTRVTEVWVDEEIVTNDSKKSILSCDINPYDLVECSGGKSMAEAEFDDNYGDIFQGSLQKDLRPLSKSKTESHVKAISGQRIRIANAPNTCKLSEVSVYDPINFDLKSYRDKPQLFSPTSLLPSIKNDKKKSPSPSMANKKMSSIPLSNRNKIKTASPKRPPRKARNIKSDYDSESDNQRMPERNYNRKHNIDLRTSRYKNNHNQSHDTIKSILKKPKDYDSSNSAIKIESDDSFEIKRGNSSQFYLPKPSKGIMSTQNILQRKRVQFSVNNDETTVIYTAEFNLEKNTVTGIAGEVNVDTEEEISAEGDVVSHSLNNIDDIDLVQLLSQEVYKDNGAYEDVIVNELTTPLIPENPELRIENETNILRIEQMGTTEDTDSIKTTVLRRSESERLTPSVIVTPPKFLDTMALRSKNKHGHTSQVFFEFSENSPFINKNNEVQIQDNSYKNGLQESQADIDNLSDSSEITKEVLKHLRQGISKSPERPPRQKSRERSKSKKNNYVKTRFVRDDSTGSTSDEWSDASDERKTVLWVKQFDSDEERQTNKPTSNEKTDKRKTSVEISNSDSFSNADDAPIYLSSVVVNNENGEAYSAYQTGTTVTISINNDQQQEIQSNKSHVYIGSVLADANKNADESNCYEEYSIHEDISSKILDSNDINNSDSIPSFLGDPVEAVKRNLVPHVCGKSDETITETSDIVENKEALSSTDSISKLLDDSSVSQLTENLDSGVVQKLIKNFLLKLQEAKNQDPNGSEMNLDKIIERSLSKDDSNLGKPDEEQHNGANDSKSKDNINETSACTDKEDIGCSTPYESMEYESAALGVFSDLEPMSDCYNASASELSTEDDTNSTRSKFYQMLVDSAMCEIEVTNDDDHHYEAIRLNSDPIYEEICDMPPPLPVNPPPNSLSLLSDEIRNGARSIFEGASKYDILSYLVDAKERGIDDEERYITTYVPENDSSLPTEVKKDSVNKENDTHLSSTNSQLSSVSDSSEENSLIINNEKLEKTVVCKKSSAEIERNDSGVGSETSKSSRSRLQGKTSSCSTIVDNDTPIHLCEDCDTAVETQVTEQGSIFAPLVCRKCAKKRAERKEIITEIVETEEKYGRDLQIILEEFYKPMLVAGLLTQEQLSAIFLNVEELIENNQVLSEKLRDALEIAVEQGDEDLLTVNVGKIMLECSAMLAAFQSYCVKQAGAALLLAGLEKEKELLRIFLRVSQMENTVLRRMNLNSFLMVPVQRVTKYPLLLSRLYRATPACASEREDVKAAQRCVESRLEEMNSAAAAAAAAARDVPLWRRLAVARRTAHDLHVADIRLRKMAVDVLDWNHDDARFAMEGKLLFTQPNDNNWRKGRTIKLTPISALLVTNGKPTTHHKPNEIRETREQRDREAREREGETLFARSGVREAALLLVREKAGRYTLQREPLFLDRCVIAADQEPDHFFEVHEVTTKDSYIFKAEENSRTRAWYRQLQYHAQGAGAWRKRRNALANIMINPMLTRN